MTPEKQRALADVLALIRARQLNELTADERTLALAAVEARAALDEARRERDALRERLATLRTATRRFCDAVADDNLTCRDNGVDSADAVEGEWQAIESALEAAR